MSPARITALLHLRPWLRVNVVTRTTSHYEPKLFIARQQGVRWTARFGTALAYHAARVKAYLGCRYLSLCWQVFVS